MSFLDNMPSRNAASFSLLVSGQASARGQSRHQRARQYMALNDTRPPDGQVIGMCLGHSVLGHDWHQQQVRLPAVEQPAPARAIRQDEGGSSRGHQRILTSPTPPRPSPRALVPAVDSAHSPNTGFRRERGSGGGGSGSSGGSGSGRADAMQGERNKLSVEQEDDGMGEVARPDRAESRDNAPRGGGRGRGRQDFTGSHAAAAAAAATTTNSHAAGVGRRRARAEVSASTASTAAAADVTMGGATCSTVADREAGAAASGLAESMEGEHLPRYGSGSSRFRTLGAWSGKTMDSTAGKERREELGLSFGEGGRVGMKKARRTYGR